MKLAGRVSVFLSATLALALATYSIVFYVLARNHLYEAFDGRLRNALDLLSASVEREDDDVKWHPAEHGINLEDESLNVVRWVVSDDRNQIIDHSPWPAWTEAERTAMVAWVREGGSDEISPMGLGGLRVLRRTLAAPAPKPERQRDPHEHAAVTVTVGASRDTLDTTLRWLGFLLSALPIAVWLLATAFGRWFVGHALTPVRAMATRARSTAGADFTLRLPVPDSGDELAELGDSFNRLLAQLQHAYEQQRRFTADAAHQLRTPVTVLQGQIEVALRRPREADAYRATLVTLGEATRELASIVETLLFLARREADAGLPDLTAMDLSAWLNDYPRRWAEHPRRSDLEVQVEAGLRAKAHPGLLGQLLDNLLDNAARYSDVGTAITLVARRDGGDVQVSVEDRGPGISPEDQPHVFEPFFRAQAARRQGVRGTGLGLSIAARIAAVLGGRLTCTSTPGHGSTFTLVLPALPHDPGPSS